MPLNLPLPDWVPWWGQLVVLILAILFGFAFMMMPFAVFGLKGRLDFLEAQLDDIHAELRMIAMRLPDPDRPPAREPVFEQLSTPPVQPRAPSPSRTQPLPQALPQPLPQPPPEPRPRSSVSVEPPLRTPQPRPFADPAQQRFAPDAQPRPSTPQRRPVRAEDWTPMRAEPAAREQHPAPGATDWDDDRADRPPRRPSRATTLRVTTPRDADRDRSEPTLRWPPRP